MVLDPPCPCRFSRGRWCGRCEALIEEARARGRELAEAHARVADAAAFARPWPDEERQRTVERIEDLAERVPHLRGSLEYAVSTGASWRWDALATKDPKQRRRALAGSALGQADRLGPGFARDRALRLLQDDPRLLERPWPRPSEREWLAASEYLAHLIAHHRGMTSALVNALRKAAMVAWPSVARSVMAARSGDVRASGAVGRRATMLRTARASSAIDPAPIRRRSS